MSIRNYFAAQIAAEMILQAKREGRPLNPAKVHAFVSALLDGIPQEVLEDYLAEMGGTLVQGEC